MDSKQTKRPSTEREGLKSSGFFPFASEIRDKPSNLSSSFEEEFGEDKWEIAKNLCEELSES